MQHEYEEMGSPVKGRDHVSPPMPSQESIPRKVLSKELGSNKHHLISLQQPMELAILNHRNNVRRERKRQLWTKQEGKVLLILNTLSPLGLH